MAVQLPQVKRIPVQGEQSVGRVNVDVPNFERPVAQVGNALEGLGKSVMGYAEAEEMHSIETQAQAAANAYEVKYKARLKEADAYQDDPTELYTKLREDTRTWANEAQAPFDDTNALNPMSYRLRDAVRDKIARVNGRLDDTAAVREAAQYSTWQTKVDDAGVTNNQNYMLDAVETLDAKNPASMARLADTIGQIQAIRERGGERTGLVRVGEDGTKQISPILRAQIAGDVSKGLVTAIETLNAAGKTEEAQMVMDRYGDELIGRDKLKALKKEHQAAIQDKTAYAEFDKLSNLPYDQQMKKIEAMKNLDPKVREKMQIISDGRRRRLEATHTSMQKESFERAARMVSDNAGQYFSTADFDKSPILKNDLRRMSPQQRKTIESMIKKGPAESDAEAIGELMDANKTGELRTMSWGDFRQKLVNLNERDRRSWTNTYKNASTDTGGEKARADKQVQVSLDEALGLYGVTKTARSQAMKPKDQRKRAQALEWVRQDLGDIDPNMAPKELAEMVKASVRRGQIQNLFTGEKRDPSAPAPTAPRASAPVVAPAPKPNALQYKDLDPTAKLKVMQEWKAAFGKPWSPSEDGPAKLNAFVAKRK